MVDMDLTALEAFVTRLIDRRMQTIDSAATVQAVNDDGTVNLDLGGGTIAPSQPALSGYTPRNVGDVVLVRNRAGEAVIQGVVGPPVPLAPAVTVTVADGPAPPGWEQVSAVWLRSSGSIWGQRVTAAPPPAVSTVTPPAAAAKENGLARLVTYRNGVVLYQGTAGQGSWTGSGPQTGLATFGAGAFSALSGRTVQEGSTLTVHRVNSGGIIGPAPLYVWQSSAVDPPSSPPGRSPGPIGVQIARNQTIVIPLPAAWLQPFAAGAANAFSFWSDAGDYVTLDSVTLAVNYS